MSDSKQTTAALRIVGGWATISTRLDENFDGVRERYSLRRHPEVPSLRADVNEDSGIVQFAYDAWDGAHPIHMGAGVFLCHDDDFGLPVLVAIAQTLDATPGMGHNEAEAQIAKIVESLRALWTAGGCGELAVSEA